jgi:pimeloyl-ACP methyl ester carboxylesterase
MASLSLPDGIELHWSEAGEGPTVLVIGFNYSEPVRLEGIVRELSRDHRAITYDLRGTGLSTRAGPYDSATDKADLEALLTHLGGARAAVAFGDGGLRAIRLAASRSDLLETVICSGSPGLPAPSGSSTDAMSSSPQVLRALVRLLETDYRAGIRTIVGGGGNPGMREARVREQVDRMTAHCSHESVVARMREWIGDDGTAEARALGNRLWLLHYPGNPWFPEEQLTDLRPVLPEAHLEHVEDGGLNRPDLTAAVLRRALSG